MSSATESAGAEGRVCYHGSLDTFESCCFKNIVHSNGNQLSIYCLQSPELTPEGFRHESECLPSQGPTPAGDSDRRGLSGAGWGRVEAAPPEAGRGSSRPSVSRLSVRRQACISKIWRDGRVQPSQLVFYLLPLLFICVWPQLRHVVFP